MKKILAICLIFIFIKPVNAANVANVANVKHFADQTVLDVYNCYRAVNNDTATTDQLVMILQANESVNSHMLFAGHIGVRLNNDELITCAAKGTQYWYDSVFEKYKKGKIKYNDCFVLELQKVIFDECLKDIF